VVLAVSGQGDDLDQALAALEEALATTEDAVERARQLSNLGLALQERYDRLGDLADLERAGSKGPPATPARGERPRSLQDAGPDHGASHGSQ